MGSCMGGPTRANPAAENDRTLTTLCCSLCVSVAITENKRELRYRPERSASAPPRFEA